MHGMFIFGDVQMLGEMIMVHTCLAQPRFWSTNRSKLTRGFKLISFALRCCGDGVLIAPLDWPATGHWRAKDLKVGSD